MAYALQLAGQFSGKLEARDLRWLAVQHLSPDQAAPGPIANPGGVLAGSKTGADRSALFRCQRGGHVFSRTWLNTIERVLFKQLLAEQRRAARVGRDGGYQPGKVAMSGMSEDARKSISLRWLGILCEQFTPPKLSRSGASWSRALERCHTPPEYIVDVLEAAGKRGLSHAG